MELKELLKALDLPEDTADIKTAVEHHNTKFLARDQAGEDPDVVSQVTGRIYGPLNNLAKKTFGLSNEDIKDKKFEDILKIGVDKFNTEITALKGQNSDDKVKTVTDELNRTKVLADQYKTDLEKAVQEKTDLETGFDNKIKGFKITEKVKEAKGKLSFAESIPELAKVGFDTQINQKYKFDLDKEDNLIVLTSEGKKVSNPTKTGKYLSIDEVLDMELEAANLKKQNGASKVNVNKFYNPIPVDSNQQQNNNPKQPQVHPRALAAAEKAKK